ncbi:MAG: hypothetical protein AB1443_11585 [Pseudomonadota bacterium]
MKNKTTLTLAAGAAFIATTAFAPIASAADNPFGMAKLDSGYQLAAADDKKKDGKCGEGKCGGDKKPADDKKKDGSCGGDKKKDGACGGKK